MRYVSVDRGLTGIRVCLGGGGGRGEGRKGEGRGVYWFVCLMEKGEWVCGFIPMWYVV